MKRILVSGAGGFVGARVMAQLSGRFEMHAFPKGMLSGATEADILSAIWEVKPDAIVHAAAISDIGESEKHPEASCRANVELPLWMAKGAKKMGAKLLCFSSDQVYAGMEGVGPFAEDAPVHPTNTYGRHKLEAEKRVLDFLPEAVMLRATWMYDFPGFGLPIRGNLLMNLLCAALRREPQRFSVNDYRGVTYVRHAIELLIPAMALPGGVYNFGSENSLSMYDTARDFVKALGLSLAIEETHGDTRSLAMDCEKARKNGVVFDDTQAGIRRCTGDYRLS